MADNQKVGFLSLGCPKALVDSEHIVTDLADEGYEIVAESDPSDVLVINTCGFIETAKEESLAAIGDALAAGREVIVTGCMGAKREELLARYPQLKHISGPADVGPVVQAVKRYLPKAGEKPAIRGEARVRLTPDHFAYLKISEGCNHDCSFCIIPDMRGKLRSRDIGDILVEAEQLVARGTRELLIIAQDLSAYGVDLKYRPAAYGDLMLESRLETLCEQLGAIAPWVRLHYVYPYPSVDRLIPLMADGLLLPYLDIPLQHAAPGILRAMRRPAAAEKTLQRIQRWRDLCPELAIRSTFIVGFPGETDDDVGQLLDFLEAAQLDRVGCFTYSPVDGAAANALPHAVDERDKLDRQEAVYEVQAEISAQRLARHVGKTLRVLVDQVGPNNTVGRTMYDAPDIDGQVFIDDQRDATLRSGDFVWVEILSHDDHDLYGTLAGRNVAFG
jgi:ribosomal protein S12 methylthiotransferase